MTALPGLTPRSPLRLVAPVLVTVEEARTANVRAVPSAGAVCANTVFSEVVERSRTAAIKHEERRFP